MSAARLISIDVGGTFTDMLTLDAEGALRSFKLPSSAPADFAALVAAAIGPAVDGDELLYSTTVTLNSLLAGELPVVGLVVTAGFRELLETARLPASAGEVAPSPLPRRLVGLEWVREVRARLDARGDERRAVDAAEIELLAREYSTAGIRVVAVSLLHSYLNPSHEQAVAAIFGAVAPEIEMVLSSTVLPELREYERTLATALNACLIPVLAEHLESLREIKRAQSAKVWLMQSNGGLASAAHIAQRPLATALSGPGAAVVGMRWLGEQSGFRDLITLDVGGTSTDVALVTDGRYNSTTAGTVAGFPIRMPMLDVLSIGAGGGSIAHQAADQRWHVGPQSAGADPGPACYGHGGQAPTLTDAQLLLGRIPDALLGGEVALDRDCANRALTAFGASRGFDAERTARGILEIATYNMCGAIRRVSVLRGYDPSTHALLAMGGAGPLHAAELAALLGIRTVVVPPQPGLAAAWGLLVADVTSEFMAPLGVLESALDPARMARLFGDLLSQAEAWFGAEGVAAGDRVVQRKLDLRYAGMSHETTIECPPGEASKSLISATLARFHEHFERLSGRSWRDHEGIEIVNLRITASGQRSKPALARCAVAGPNAAAPMSSRRVGFLHQGASLESAVFARSALGYGTKIGGPAVIEQYESTVVIPPGWAGEVDAWGNLLLRPER